MLDFHRHAGGIGIGLGVGLGGRNTCPFCPDAFIIRGPSVMGRSGSTLRDGRCDGGIVAKASISRCQNHGGVREYIHRNLITRRGTREIAILDLHRHALGVGARYRVGLSFRGFSPFGPVVVRGPLVMRGSGAARGKGRSDGSLISIAGADTREGDLRFGNHGHGNRITGNLAGEIAILGFHRHCVGFRADFRTLLDRRRGRPFGPGGFIVPFVVGGTGHGRNHLGDFAGTDFGAAQRNRRQRIHRHLRRGGSDTAIVVGHGNGLGEVLCDVLLSVWLRGAFFDVFLALRILNPRIKVDVIRQTSRG